MAVDQKDKSIKIHLDNYFKDALAEYLDYIKKSLRPEKVPTSPGVVLKAEDVPESPDPHKQKILLVRGEASVCGNMDPVRYFVHGIAVGTVLCISWTGSMGSSTPSYGISCGAPQLQNTISQGYYETSGSHVRVC